MSHLGFIVRDKFGMLEPEDNCVDQAVVFDGFGELFDTEVFGAILEGRSVSGP
jgi:hypothetical protein